MKKQIDYPLWIILVVLCLITGTVQAQLIITNTEGPGSATQYEKAEFTIETLGAFTNPYRSNDIRVDMVLLSPSGANLVLPCYYESGTSPTAVWKARFSPRENGEFSYYFEFRIGGVLMFTTEPAMLTVAEGTRDGFLITNNNWSFRFDSGKPFRGIGENVGWESRVWENDLHDYDYLLSQLSEHGGNFFRTWMSAWNLPLEWSTVVDTRRYTNSDEYYHPEGIARMDELVELCENLDLYMMLTLDWHGGLQTGDRWSINPYNAANGGPAATPTEFFTSAEAREQYKDRLRYIVARWGYSTSIGAWEFFNEIDNAAYNGTENSLAIPTDAIVSWHDEMSTYLKSIDPYDHIVTTSVSHRELGGLFAVPNIDVVQRHIYKNTSGLPAAIKEGVNTHRKPFVIGEFGYDWDWNNIGPAIGDELEHDFKRGLWYGLFAPTPILPMSWWWEFFHERGTTGYFQGVRDVSDKMLEAGDGEFESVTVAVIGSGFEAFGARSGESYYVYLLNNTASPVNGKRIRIPVAGDGVFAIRKFNPETGQWSDFEVRATAAGRVTTSGISLESRESVILEMTPHSGPVTSVHSEFNKISLYPNPARGKFIVNLTEPASRMTIYNAHATIISSTSGTLTGSVSSPELKPGAYLVVIEYADGRREYLKSIVIQ